MTRPRVLWVTEEAPDRDGGGGGIRQANLLVELAKHFDICLLVATAVTDTAVREAVAEVVEVPLGPPRRDLVPPRLRSAWNLWVRRRGLSVAGSMPAIRVLAPELAARHHDHDIVVLNHEELFSLLPIVSGHAGPVVAHLFDVKSVRAEQSADLVPSRRRARMWAADARAMRRLEVDGLGAVDLVVVPSDDDVQALQRFAPTHHRAAMVVVPNGVDLQRFRPTPAPRSGQVLFFGSLHYAPNVDGVVWLAREIWPLVRESTPDAILSVVGHRPEPEVHGVGEVPGVDVVGEVPDAPPWYAASDVVVVPLRVGTGTRLKALEAMASGRPVVGTSIGLAGLGLERADGPARIVDDAAGFAAAVVTLLEDPDAAAALGAAGRRHVEEHFGWGPIAAAMVRALDGALHTTRSEP